MCVQATISDAFRAPTHYELCKIHPELPTNYLLTASISLFHDHFYFVQFSLGLLDTIAALHNIFGSQSLTNFVDPALGYVASGYFLSRWFFES